MIEIDGYRIKQEIYKSGNSIVYRGIRESDNRPVVIKTSDKEYPNPKELSGFMHEYELMKRVTGDGIIKVYELRKYNESLAIVMEDIGGDSVSNLLPSLKLGIMEKLKLAIKMTESLLQLHKHNVIHKDVNPSNFIWNTKTNELKIIDLDIATEAKETFNKIGSSDLEGTLDYISPEQTGRINRPIDNRSDLYSLGITLYELFSGQKPFKGDESEIVYCHIAKTPISPSKVNAEVPAVISDIIMKLISKAAEDRYQSAFGLKQDLNKCLQMMQTNKNFSGFKLGEYDVLERFVVSRKLYGREKEIGELIKSFQKAVGGSCEFVLVSGYSGVGKSSLVNEIRNSVMDRKGRFVSGKFSESERNTPYYGLILAFSMLIKQLLAEPQHNLDSWKQRFMDALGSNGQVMIDIIPELDKVIGPQPPAVQLDPLAAQNRFRMVFRDFVKVLAEESPLVIFLDDLQWTDNSTVDMLKYLLEGKLPHVLLIGAYRDSELQTAHPLNGLINELKTKGVLSFNEITLEPLDLSAITRLMEDTLHSNQNKIDTLAELILHKTKGNPFFINRLLNALYLQGAFTLVPDKGLWEYDLSKIQSADISDNVVELLIKSLDTLPGETLEILKLAACIGNQFDLILVSELSNKSVAELGECMVAAVENEIVIPIDSNFRVIDNMVDIVPSSRFEISFCFSHDRIRHAVYSLLSKKEESKIHMMIGRKYLDIVGKREDLLFDTVNHLNIGRALIKDVNERIELFDLNFSAGKKAKKSTAFKVASGYFKTAESMLSGDEWSGVPQKKLFNLYMEYAPAALLSGDPEEANMLCNRMMDIAQNNVEKGLASNIRAQILEFQGRFPEAIEEIRRRLLSFDIFLPENNAEIGQKVQEGVMKMKAFLTQKPVEELANLPEMKDPEKVMAMQLLFQLVPSALHYNPQLFFLTALIMFELTYKYGTSPMACKCFTDCGMILNSMLSDYQTSYKLGEAAFALIRKYKAEALKPAVYFGFTFCSQWCANYKESLEYYDMAYQKGLETGDIQHSAYAISHKLHLMMWTGKILPVCKADTESAIAFLSESKNAMPLLLAQMVHYIIQEFQAAPTQDGNTDIIQTGQNILKRIEEINDLPFLVRFYQYNAFLNIILGDMGNAEKWNAMAEKIIFASMTDFPIADHYLFRALILISKWNEALPEEQVQIKEALSDILKRMKNWSDNCPDNFAHKYYLLCTKMAVMDNQPLDNIVDLFKKTLDSIGSGDFIQFKALCNEYYGQFWLDRGDETIGKTFIREAYNLYQQWGAYRKVAELEKKYSGYFDTYENRGDATRSNSTGKISIDVASILKSSQAISKEIKVEKLLMTFILTITENAGAQKGLLLLNNEVNNQLYIVAKNDVNAEHPQIMKPLIFSESEDLCPEIVQYVSRTREITVIRDATSEGNWKDNRYIIDNHIKSVLCMPVIYQTRFMGVIYLENNLSDNVFTSERLEIINILSSQAAISIENARLYQNMEEKVRERTAQLNLVNEKLKEMSFRDPLTNLYNRRYTFEHISDMISNFIYRKRWHMNNQEKRELFADENVIGVLLLDIDHFKEVNDTYGHSAGDIALISVSNALKQMIRSDDFLVRWGGEEFLIILYNTKPDYLERFSRKIIDTIMRTPIEVAENETIYKTCSLGYAEMPLDNTNPDLVNLEQTINLSDYALYRAKENGRNCAAHISLKKRVESEDDFIRSIVKLSKQNKVENKYIKVEFINPK